MVVLACKTSLGTHIKRNKFGVLVCIPTFGLLLGVKGVCSELLMLQCFVNSSLLDTFALWTLIPSRVTVRKKMVALMNMRRLGF